ncbi:hypothetical protein BT69DRAFT_1328518 [Atractiella rhizophila]|nr:hypothetical protein BT69DRAFT_1328518 [Atractiella rhizophila]
MTSAAFTASISIADAIVFAITSLSSNAHLALYVLHPSTHALTTIFTLNARERLKDELHNSRTPVSGSRDITEATTPKASSYKLNNLAQRSAQRITVHVATQSFRDDLEKNPIEKDRRAMEVRRFYSTALQKGTQVDYKMDSDHRFAI